MLPGLDLSLDSSLTMLPDKVPLLMFPHSVSYGTETNSTKPFQRTTKSSLQPTPFLLLLERTSSTLLELEHQQPKEPESLMLNLSEEESVDWMMSYLTVTSKMQPMSELASNFSRVVSVDGKLRKLKSDMDNTTTPTGTKEQLSSH